MLFGGSKKTGGNPLETEPVSCSVKNNKNSGVVVTFPKGYYQFKISYSYQQFDRSNESIYYRDSAGNGHRIGSLYADDYGYSPGYTIQDLILDISLFETPEALKNKTSFSIYFSPNSRDPHFNSFTAIGLRRVGGALKSAQNHFVYPLYPLCQSVKRYWKRGVEHVVRR